MTEPARRRFDRRYSPALPPSKHVAPLISFTRDGPAILADCRSFWRCGGPLLDLWSAEIRVGKVPTFGKYIHI